jgi:hypothetical protein
MKKIAIMVFSILVMAVLLTGCDQLQQWQGNAKITGLAKYYDKASGSWSDIKVSLLSAVIVVNPGHVPLDVAPLTKTTGGNGTFSFDGIAPGTYVVVAEDPDGEYQPANAVVTVAQDGTAETEDLVLTKAVTHVVIFRDGGSNSEWGNTTAIGDTLETEVGMTEGTGANQYEYKTSSEMATFTPTLGELVIIGGDQTTAFYNAYTTNKAIFDNFVDDGGSMYWIGCDGGWAVGNFTSSLPGGVTWRDRYENYNDIVYFEHPITKNFPEQLYGNYASHGGFDNLATLTTIANVMTYAKEDVGLLPTYIEYRTGYGKVLATTTPLEYYVTNGPTTMPTGFLTSYKDLFKLMLTRSIRYMMNLDVSEDVPASAGLRALSPSRASH